VAERSELITARRKLMMISPVFPPAIGGIQTISAGLAERLTEFDLSVVTLEEPGWEGWDRQVPYRVSRTANHPAGGRRAVTRMNLLGLNRALRSRPDVILAMHVRAAYASAIISRIERARWVQYYHAREISEFPKAAKLAIRLAQGHAGPSRYTDSLLREHGLRARMDLVPPAIPPYRAENRARRRNLIFTVSRLSDPHKGHDMALRAMPAILRELPDARWVIAGDGPLRASLERLARDLRIAEAIEWVGAIDDLQRDKLFATAEVFLMPSRVPRDKKGGEGFGIVYIEAAAAGLPSICANEGGATDAVKEGYSGYRVDPRDPNAIATAVVRLLRDRSALHQMSIQAREWAGEFTWERTMEAMRAVLDR